MKAYIRQKQKCHKYLMLRCSKCASGHLRIVRLGGPKRPQIPCRSFFGPWSLATCAVDNFLEQTFIRIILYPFNIWQMMYLIRKLLETLVSGSLVKNDDFFDSRISDYQFSVLTYAWYSTLLTNNSRYFIHTNIYLYFLKFGPAWEQGQL